MTPVPLVRLDPKENTRLTTSGRLVIYQVPFEPRPTESFTHPAAPFSYALNNGIVVVRRRTKRRALWLRQRAH